MRRIARQPILHPDAWTGVVFVFDLGFGKRRLVLDAPIDRPQAFVDETALENLVKSLNDGRFVLWRHRQVRILPAAEDSDAPELAALQINVLFRVGAAGLSHLQRRHFELLSAKRFVNLDLDWQAVAVPSGDVWRVKARHCFRFHHEVF